MVHNFEQYKRPFVELDETESLELQVLDVEDASALQNPLDPPHNVSPLIRIFGCTRLSQSICLLVHGFFPYFYFPVTSKFTEANVTQLHRDLDQHLTTSKADILKIQLIHGYIPLKHFRPKMHVYNHFLKITLAKPQGSKAIQKVLEESESYLAEWYKDGKLYDPITYESNVSFVMKFMVDTGIGGGAWLQIPPRRWARFGSRSNKDFPTGTQHMITVHVNDLVSHNGKEHPKWVVMADLRSLTVMLQILPIKLEDNDNDNDNKTRAPEPSKTPTKTTTPKKKMKITPKKSQVTDAGGDEDIDPVSVSYIPIVANTLVHSDKTKPTVTILFVLDPANTKSKRNPPNNSHLNCPSDFSHTTTLVYTDEATMLIDWLHFVSVCDPDILTGYDVTMHITFLLNRLNYLCPRRTLPALGRDPALSATSKRAQVYQPRNNRRMGSTSNREFRILKCPGRVVLNMRVLMEREERLRSYNFGEAVQEILKKTQEVIDVKTLRRLWGSEDIHNVQRVLHYAAKEVRVAWELSNQGHLVTLVELARVTGLNITDVVHRGQMLRFQSQLLSFCKPLKHLIPNEPHGSNGQMVEGPLVLAPELGYNTDDPVAILDFSSLYPSIIIAHNLCYSTHVDPSDVNRIKDEYRGKIDRPDGAGADNNNDDDHIVHKVPGPSNSSSWFVSQSVKKGVIPQILEHFIAERKKVKRLMNQETDTYLKAVLNGRQLALKVSANAVYGATGAPESFLQMLAIAEATVLLGAGMLMTVKDSIEKKYSKAYVDTLQIKDKNGTMKALGTSGDCRIVYGDTDSVFVKIPGVPVHDAIELSHIISDDISALFRSPIKLAFEKVYFPSLFMQRKRYAGLKWTNSTAPDEIDARGIESRRRDICPIVITTMEAILDKLFIHKDNAPPDGLIEADVRKDIVNDVKDYVKTIVEKTTRGEYDLGMFIVTKGLWLGTESDDYKSKQAHIELINRLRQRDPLIKFDEGERVSYVFIRGGDKGFEKSEDPLFAMENSLALDYKYYIDHMISKPLSRVLVQFLSEQEAASLFTVRYVDGGTSSINSPAKGAITNFFTKSEQTASCLRCKNKIPANQALCTYCRPLISQVYSQVMSTKNDYLGLQSKYFSLCRRCQESPGPIYCTSLDCSIFYKRHKVKEDLVKIGQDFNRLEIDLERDQQVG